MIRVGWVWSDGQGVEPPLDDGPAMHLLLGVGRVVLWGAALDTLRRAWTLALART